MTEIPLLFGPEDARLVGVVTRTDHPQPQPVVCLLLNQGIYYRIGPRRINVKLARMLADAGVSCLRFDVGGLGDSASPQGDGDYLKNGMQDMRSAMDAAQALLGIDRFVVVGLCSGGHHGLSTAVVDPRVVGLMMFESYTFATPHTLRVRQWRKMLALPFNRSMQMNALKAAVQRLKRAARPIFETPSALNVEQHFRDAMAAVARRGLPVCMLYSGSVHVVDRGRDQLGALAGEAFMRDIEYHFDPRLDHNLTTLEGQRIFLDLARDWVLRVAARTGTVAAPVRTLPTQEPVAEVRPDSQVPRDKVRPLPVTAFGALG